MEKVKNARVIAVDSKVHHKLRVVAAMNNTGIGTIAEKAILKYIDKKNG